MGIYGQDWASYQGSTPSAKGLAFVFIKVTEGLTYVSSVWKAQVAAARKAGAVVGYYHYPHMHNNPDAEVNYFLSKVTPVAGEMIVLDWEGYDKNNRDLSSSELRSYKEEYMRFMKSKLPHNPVGMYCNTDYWLRVDTTSHTGDFLWIATGNRPAGSPGIQADWKFHQYSASPVDKDYGNFASADELKTWVHSFDKTITEDIVTPAEIKAVAKATADLLVSPAYRDALALANMYWLDKALSDEAFTKPVGAQDSVTRLQGDFKRVLGKLDPTVLAELQKAVQDTIKNTAITATVNVNGTVK